MRTTGRTLSAHFSFIRMNAGLTIFKNQFEDNMDLVCAPTIFIR